MKKQLATALAMILLAGSSMAETDYSRQNEKNATPHRPTVPMTFQNYQRNPTMTYHSDGDLQAMARQSLESDKNREGF